MRPRLALQWHRSADTTFASYRAASDSRTPGFATHPVAFTRHYPPNLAVSAKAIARLWVDSRIAVGYDQLRRISVREVRLVRRRIAPAPSSELQFERAEFSSGNSKSTCANCKKTASPEYHELSGKIFCTTCRQRIEASIDNLDASQNVPRAFLWGLGAAVLGALIFYGVSALTGYQIGLIAVVVGWLVGKAVRKGSGSLGGRKYQIMAVLLTYASIASTSVPAITKYLEQQATKVEEAAANPQASTAAAPVQPGDALPARPVKVVHVGYVRFYIYVFALSLALPFLNITRDILGFVIIAIGLWEAWKFTRAASIQFKGPFSVSPC